MAGFRVVNEIAVILLRNEAALYDLKKGNGFAQSTKRLLMVRRISKCALILSPHRDDAAFSCGLLLERLAMRGVSIRIANVCTISDYAPYSGSAIVTDLRSVTSLRAREDEVFSTLLQRYATRSGQEIELLNQKWKDAPLRLQIATDDVLNNRCVVANEAEQLAKEFRAFSTASFVLAPLALGNHLDHRLVSMAAAYAWQPDQLLFYEDQPYICRIPEPERLIHIRDALPWPCLSWTTPSSYPDTKRRMALCYKSQIAEAVANEMEEYAAAASYTERVHGNVAALQTLKSIFMARATYN